MDPNETLREMLNLATTIQLQDAVDCPMADDLAERVIALHDWIMNGGALPVAWQWAKKER